MIEALAVIGALALVLHALDHLRPSRPTRAVAPEHEVRPPQLERVERALILSSTAQDAHLRLRPLLREIALARLWARGIDLDGRPEAARALLGAPLWELVRPDRPPPDGREPGPTSAELDALLARLEEL